jgi:hypothetical protein
VQAAGPDEEANGLDLCVLHPKLFLRFVDCQYPLGRVVAVAARWNLADNSRAVLMQFQPKEVAF